MYVGKLDGVRGTCKNTSETRDEPCPDVKIKNTYYASKNIVSESPVF